MAGLVASRPSMFSTMLLSGEAESANEEAAKTFYPVLKQKIVVL